MQRPPTGNDSYLADIWLKVIKDCAQQGCIACKEILKEKR